MLNNKKKINFIRQTTIIFLLIANASLVHAQELSGFSGFNAAEFGLSIARAEVSARVAVWNPKDRTGYIAVRFVYPDTFHQIDDPDYFTLEPLVSEGVVYGSVLKPEPVYGQDGSAEYIEPTTLLLEFAVMADSGLLDMSIIAHFQLCDPLGTCLPPDNERLEIQFNPADRAIEADESVLEILRWNDQTGNIQVPTWRNLLLYLLMAFFGGILLNFLPCILPLLSVKALGLIKQATVEHRTILNHAWFYVLGIEVSFWILAAIVIVIKASGSLLGWGFQFQSPIFLLVLISIIWVFALSLFDVFVIEAPRKGLKIDAGARVRGGYIGSFLTGVFAVVVATPCMAPLLGAAMGFAFFQTPIVVLTVFSVTGIGFGLPFLLLGFNPGIIKKLPKPGAWMSTFKEAMGFLLLGTAVYLFNSFSKLASDVVNSALWWFLILGFAAWLLGKARHPSSRQGFRILGQIAVVAIILIAGIGFIGPKLAGLSRNNASKNLIVEFEETDFQNRMESGESIFLEYSAEWCTICKLNQRVFNNREVKKLMAEKNIVHIKADLTSYNEVLLRRLAEFGKAGVPLYVLYIQGMEPYVFPSLITVNHLTEKFAVIP